MDRVPAEILLHVFDFLDGPAPSEQRLHDQPSHDMLEQSSQPLKQVSLVSRAWRTLSLPQLYRHILWRPKVSSLTAFTLNPIPLLRFLDDHGLARGVDTFTLLVDFVDDEANARQKTPRIRSVDLEWFWDQLFSIIDPLRFTIIAPPTTLAALVSITLFLEDAWSFNVPCHILSLARPKSARDASNRPPPPVYPHPHLDSDDHASSPLELGRSNPDPAIAGPSRNNLSTTPSRVHASKKQPPPSPLFTIRPWTSLLLNEGSSTKVYQTYEFWIRRPPSLLDAILGNDEFPEHAPLIPSSVVDLNYIAIFPPCSHFETLLLRLPRIDRLFVQLTPKSDNRILEDEDQMKHIDPADLWLERATCYALLMQELGYVPEPRRNWAFLQVFESGDAADREAWEMAVGYVERMGIKSWKVEREGVFVKHIEGEEKPGWNGHVNGHHDGQTDMLEPRFLSVPPISYSPFYYLR
ncbi:hypothetical protein F4778DRAFT_611792 [Xylariomycetidae sp. FL2044]|nr:hypothetical protein F4778DRAFT_611792 [Xylariomycetidae sp. FL2044]